jgi:hypothetical protein
MSSQVAKYMKVVLKAGNVFTDEEVEEFISCLSASQLQLYGIKEVEEEVEEEVVDEDEDEEEDEEEEVEEEVEEVEEEDEEEEVEDEEVEEFISRLSARQLRVIYSKLKLKEEVEVEVEDEKEKFEYAVVSWFNYRKELGAGFIKGFNDFEEARKYAYSLAEDDMISGEEEEVITEDEITDGEGPGDGGPYKTIIGYGGHPTGYSTVFYCVVSWFSGVENSWDWTEDLIWEDGYGGYATQRDEDELEEECKVKWVPRY